MASGRIYGTCTGEFAKSYQFWVDWSSTPDNVHNTSNLSATAYLKCTNSSFQTRNLDVPANEKKLSIWADHYYSNKKGIDLRNGRTELIAQKMNYTVQHNSSGYVDVTIQSSFPYVTSSLTGGKLSKSITLDKIDVQPPKFTQNPYVVSSTQTTVKIKFGCADVLNEVKYTTDGHTWKVVDKNAREFTVTGLKPNTKYSIYVSITKSINQKTSGASVTAMTLPIYVTKINVPAEFLIQQGEHKKLPIEIEPTDASIKKVILTSDNNGIVKIDGENLIGVSKGFANITVKATDGSNKTATSVVTVKKSVSGITVSPNEITLKKGDSITLAYKIEPADADDQSVTVIVDDTMVAQADGTTITAIENGVTKITIKTNDGGYETYVNLTVTGEYTWYEYSAPLDILNAEDVMHIYSNFKTLRAMMLVNGITIEPFQDVSVTKATPLIEMFDTLKKMEYNLDRLNETPYESIYYKEPKIVGEIAENKEDIFRWIQCMNEIYAMLQGHIGKWQVLRCTDGYPTIDGHKILVRSDV